ncbi:TonB-dependent receptor plug domain-containing protein [Solemya velesiana gill symbiont]|uniref:TonB-dependent receptor n=1 Tax=Solemya velesiana gill symbiont TaxID=1918948 RepID=A0A1T2KX33_9GAMM|nr:TonB-dependent receptor [Solemya velesiana gill symbiont]OOZ37382.1 hypothetical protein BOW51_02705 [Solemya velesiana gill symbiont]
MRIDNQQRVKRIFLAFTTGSALLGLGQPVYAQENLSEDLFFGEIPVVLTATRIRQPIENLPASITVIDRDMINASGASTIPDLLRLVPGFQIGVVTGSRYTASYHGVADQYPRDMQVLVDGRSVYDPTFGGVTWSDLPVSIEDIQRIEVIRGPNAAAYGSNSFAGIINIITEHPSSQQGVATNLLLGQARNRKIHGRFADRLENLDYRLSVTYDEGDGYTGRHDDFDTQKLDFRGDYSLSDKDGFLIKLGFTDGLREDGVAGDEFQPFRTVDTDMHYQQLRWTRQLADNNEFSLQFYHNYQLLDDFYELPPPYTGIWIGLSQFESHRADLEFQHNLTLGEDWKIAWGLGARHDRGKSHWLMGTDDWITRDQARAFINAEKPISDQLVLNLGGMVEKFENQDALFSPRLGLNYHFDERNTLRIGRSHAYRVPTLVDQNADVRLYDANMNTAVLPPPLPPIPLVPFYLTVGDLKPQKIESFEVGYIGSFPRYGITLDAKLFKEKITNAITAAADDPTNAPFDLYQTYQFINGGFYDLSGYELEFNWRPSPSVLLHAGFSHIDFSGKKIEDVGDSPESISSNSEPVSKHMINLLGSYRFDDGLEISAAYYRTAELAWSGDGDIAPDSTRANIKVSKSFRLDGADGEASVTLENISADDPDFYLSNIPDTRLYLQLKMNWN